MRYAFALVIAIVTLAGCDPSQEETLVSEHAVLVYFEYGTTDLTPLFSLERRLESAIVAERAGEYDGNEVAADGSDGVLYMYGPDADRLFQVIKPLLEAESFMQGARVKLRYGPPEDGVHEAEFKIGT